MCSLIFKDHKVIEFVKELKEEYPYLELLPASGYININEDSCLCQLDLNKMFEQTNIDFEFDGNYTLEDSQKHL